MRKIKIKLPNAEIPVFIGDKASQNLSQILLKQKIKNNVFVVADSIAWKKHPDVFKEPAAAFPRFDKLSVKSTEEIKTLDGLQKIYDKLLAKKFGRDTTIIAFGGGVIGDLAGFAAATFARGVKLVQVPTTLLAMVDSSIGGKTGINYGNVKNIVGAFYQPEFILIDTRFLQTLPRTELISGLGEIVKYGYLTDEKFFAFVEKNLDAFLSKDEKILNDVVFKSVKIKASVVEQDEKESGLRKILNLGHTFAHAFESQSAYSLAHGKAVLLGIYSAILLSEKLGYAQNLSERYSDFILRLKKDFGQLNFSPQKLYSVMQNDKKTRDGKIKFVLPINFGEIALDVEADKKIVTEVLRKTVKILERER